MLIDVIRKVNCHLLLINSAHHSLLILRILANLTYFVIFFLHTILDVLSAILV